MFRIRLTSYFQDQFYLLQTPVISVKSQPAEIDQFYLLQTAVTSVKPQPAEIGVATIYLWRDW